MKDKVHQEGLQNKHINRIVKILLRKDEQN